MIPEVIVQNWKYTTAPWPTFTMVEQDLILSRALVNLYEQPEIRKNLVFRGGTALNKLYITPPARYSEDLDFVQIKAEPIGKIIDAIRSALDAWLGEPKRKRTKRSVKLTYRFNSCENIPAKLKIEINVTEHYHFLDLVELPFEINSEWFSGKTKILTYQLVELMGSKLRALYQRRKGRDLFDMWYVTKLKKTDEMKILDIFLKHCQHDNIRISRNEFKENFSEKYLDENFKADMKYLIHPNIDYNFDKAYKAVMSIFINKLHD